MGGEGSGRKPDVMKIIERQQKEAIQFNAPDDQFIIPNYSGIKTSALKQNYGWILSGTDIYYNAGNVGIGTTAPNFNLVVINATDPTFLLGTAQTGGTYGFMQYVTASNYLRFSTGGNTIPLILQDAGGNVGIGTTAPATLLEVKGDALFDRSGGSTLYIQTPASDARLVTGGSYPIILDGSGNANQVYLATGGNVGIATTAPSRILDVGGSATPYVAFTPSATNNQWVIGSDGSGFIIYDDTNNEYRAAFSKTDNAGLSIGTSYYSIAAPSNGLIVEGNVGIGTASPAAQLSVTPTGTNWNEGIEVNPSSNGYGAIFFRQTAGSITNTWFFGKESSNDFGVVRNGLTGMVGTSRVDAPFEITTTGVAKFGGNVGIGTTTPQTPLDIKGTFGLSGTNVASLGTLSGALFVSGGALWYKGYLGTITNVALP